MYFFVSFLTHPCLQNYPKSVKMTLCLKSAKMMVVVIAAAQLHSAKTQLRFCAGSNPACGVSKIPDGEDL